MLDQQLVDWKENKNITLGGNLNRRKYQRVVEDFELGESIRERKLSRKFFDSIVAQV